MTRCRWLLTCAAVLAAAAATAGAEDAAKETDGRLRVAIVRFDVGQGLSIDAGTFTDALSTTLAKQGNFVCIERRRIAKVIDEKDFQIAMRDPKRAVGLAKLLGADSLIYGSVGRLGAEYVAVCHMVDVKSGKVLVSSGARCKGGGSLSTLATQAAGEVLAAFPPEGVILKLQKGGGGMTAIIDLGKGNGVTTKTKLIVLDEQVMVHPRTKKTIRVVRKLGVLQPTGIEHEFTTAKVSEDMAAKLKPGQCVRAVTPVQQIKRSAMLGETFNLAFGSNSSVYGYSYRWKAFVESMRGHLARNLYGTGFRLFDRSSAKLIGGQKGLASVHADLLLVFRARRLYGHRSEVFSAHLLVAGTYEQLAGCSRQAQTSDDGSEVAADVARMLQEWYGKYQKGKPKDKTKDAAAKP